MSWDGWSRMIPSISLNGNNTSDGSIPLCHCQVIITLTADVDMTLLFRPQTSNLVFACSLQLLSHHQANVPCLFPTLSHE
jgi:hypothetical protein